MSTAREEVARSDYNLLQNKYVSVTAMSDEMKTIWTRDSEMVQLLHQCATFRRLSDNTNRTPPRKGVVLNIVKRELIET